MATRLKAKNSNSKTEKIASFGSVQKRLVFMLNMLSIKPIFIANEYMARNKREFSFSKEKMAKAEIAAKRLKQISRKMENSNVPETKMVHNLLKDYISAYVDIFYSLDRKERIEYLKICEEEGISKKREHNINLITLPAFMAELGEKKEETERFIISALYIKPAVFVHEHGAKVYSLNRYLESISAGAWKAKDSTGEIMKELNDLISSASRKEADIDTIKMKKDEIISSLLNLNEESNIKIFDSISEKIMPFEYKPSRFIRR